MAGNYQHTQKQVLSYPTHLWTLPVSLKHVFQFKSVEKPTKTGVKPSVQTHTKNLKNPVLNKVKSQALIPLVGPFLSEDDEPQTLLY